MITLIEALNYRCLKYVRQPLGPFHILVGPNASGKSSLLDTLAFLSDVLSEGLEAAAENRSPDFGDLVFGRPQPHEARAILIRVEARIPPEYGSPQGQPRCDTIAYTLEVHQAPHSPPHIFSENVTLRDSTRLPAIRDDRLSFPPQVCYRSADRHLEFFAETHQHRSLKTVISEVSSGKSTGEERFPDYHFQFNPGQSALRNLPEDQTRFPITTWFKSLLLRGVTLLELDARALRKASPKRKDRIQPDGSSTPWLLKKLLESDGGNARYRDWVRHLQTVIPDLKGISTVHRADDGMQYLKIEYRDGLQVPSWAVSDGTLRLIALTLLAYLPDTERIYLIEEPENSIHPRALEAVYHSLSSVYDGQVLVTTHSPLLVGLARLEELLCFQRDEQDGTMIVSGDQHPMLTDWRGEVDLGTFFAGGVLG